MQDVSIMVNVQNKKKTINESSKISDKLESYEMEMLDCDKITKFHSFPNEQFHSEKDIAKYYGYIIDTKLANENISNVFKAYHQKTKQDVVCKIVDLRIKSSNLQSSVKVSDIKNEINIMNRLQNRYIIRLYAHFVANLQLYLFMKLANNGTMFHYVKEKGPISQTNSRIFFSQILVGLEHMHDSRIAHRDLKLENILLVKNSNEKISILISDFGLSRIIGTNFGKTELLKSFSGTVSYMAPEIILRKAYDAFLADVWSCGIILYSILNAAFPFDQSDIKIQLKSSLLRDWNWYISIIPTKELDHLLRLMLEPDVLKRARLNTVIEHVWINEQFQISKYDEL